MSKNKLEKLKKKLNKAIKKYGTHSVATLKISQELDLYIVKEMKRGNKDDKKI